jgi:hypothetical protein
MWKLGLDLMRTGRFSLRVESIRRRGELQRLLAAADENRVNR